MSFEDKISILKEAYNRTVAPVLLINEDNKIEFANKRAVKYFKEELDIAVGSTLNEFPAEMEVELLELDDRRFKVVSAFKDGQMQNNNTKLDMKKEQYEKLFYESPAGILLFDCSGKIIKANQLIVTMLGYDFEDLIGQNVFEVVIPEENHQTAKENIKKIMSGQKLEHIVSTRGKIGEKKHVLLKESRVKLTNGEYGILSMHIDITDYKLQQERVRFISYHDELTGLYNRKFIEKELERLNDSTKMPISIIMADVNGLKLVNDSYGHRAGDQLIKNAARILKKSVNQDGIVARWGGDEFVILLTETGRKESRRIINEIIAETNKTEKDEIPISMGLGLAVKNKLDIDIYEILNEADKEMYHNKFSSTRVGEERIIQSLLNSLGSQSGETSEHARRMTELSRKIGEKLNLPAAEIRRLYLLANLHDIGKITIPKEILNKNGGLTEKEWEIMKEHPLKGKQIALATEEFSTVAEEIYCHHERWDGTGYPRGLKGNEVPYLARIISIVDAFDVMTNRRTYSLPVSTEEAIAELKRCAGSQFDPELVEVAIEVIESEV